MELKLTILTHRNHPPVVMNLTGQPPKPPGGLMALADVGAHLAPIEAVPATWSLGNA